MSRNDNIINNYVEGHLPNDDPTSLNIQNVPEPKNKDNEIAKDCFQNSKEAAIMSAPVMTGLGLMMILTPGDDQFGIGSAIRMLGVPAAIGGLVVDVVKLPFTVTWSISAFVAGVVFKIKSLFTNKKNEQQIREITESFMHRFANTMQLLVALKLETAETITNKLNDYKNGKDSSGLASLCALTILNTAYASRRLPDSSILLANGKILRREHCPKIHTDIFDSVLEIRNLLRQLDLHRKSNSDAISIILKILPVLKKSLENKNYSDELLLDEKNNKFLFELNELLKDIGTKLTNYKYSKNNITELRNNSNISINNIPERVKDAILNDSNTLNDSFVDYHTKELITDAVVGSNGFLYNYSTARKLYETKQLTRFLKFYSAGGPSNPQKNSEEFIIDPITCNEIENHVVANDGHIYDRSTAIYLINNKMIGVGYIIITYYINCPEMLKWN